MNWLEFERVLSAAFPESHNGYPGVCRQIEGGNFLHLEFMMHNDGCWAILSNRASGKETGRINLGTYKTMEEIEDLIAVLGQGR